MKKYCFLLLLCLLAVGLCVALCLPRTEAVQLEGTLLQWQNDTPEVLEQRSFRLEGQLERRLAQKPQLYASLHIDGITESWPAQQVWVAFTSDRAADGATVWQGNLQVYHPWVGDGADPRTEPELLYEATDWLIRMEPDTGAFCLFCPPGLALHTPKDELYSLENGSVLLHHLSGDSAVFSFPADAREEAVTLTKRLWPDPCDASELQWLEAHDREPIPGGWR